MKSHGYWVASILTLFLVSPVFSVSAQKLQVSGVPGLPESIPAEQSGRACFTVQGIDAEGAAVFLTVDGPRGEVGGQPGFADRQTQMCVTISPVPFAGEWQGCMAPREVHRETYVATARVDRAGDDSGDSGQIEEGFMSWPIERPVSEIEPRPEECDDLTGNWTFTFLKGTLNCDKLPMTVSLPGFSESVVVEEVDPADLFITGSKTHDRLRLVNGTWSDGPCKSKSCFYGRQDVSQMFDGHLQKKALYEVFQKSATRMEGKMTLNRTAYRKDICSIDWPFVMTAIEGED